jgi:2'-5' RNA ligase
MMNSGMQSDPNAAALLSEYALVAYLPDPLGKFLDRLRGDLVAGCDSKAHVTVLPPRRLAADPETAIGFLTPLLAGCPAFEVHMGGVEVFPVSEVIYISVAKGESELRRLHEDLNRGVVAYQAVFPYHPHITLAQGLDTGVVQERRESACRQWAAFSASRTFLVDRVWFVRNTDGRGWENLKEFPLNGGRPGGA